LNVYQVYTYIGPFNVKGRWLGYVFAFDVPTAYGEAARKWPGTVVVVEKGGSEVYGQNPN
jgi:hypothetical protein